MSLNWWAWILCWCISVDVGHISDVISEKNFLAVNSFWIWILQLIIMRHTNPTVHCLVMKSLIMWIDVPVLLLVNISKTFLYRWKKPNRSCPNVALDVAIQGFIFHQVLHVFFALFYSLTTLIVKTSRSKYLNTTLLLDASIIGAMRNLIKGKEYYQVFFVLW